MDGNRRYAKEQGLSSFEGHYAGFEKMREFLPWAEEAGVKELTLYAFSTENWNRKPEEVGYLMELFDKALSEWAEEVVERGTRLRFIGERDRFPEKLAKRMNELEARTKDATRGTIVLALSYGGRTEILSAVNELLSRGLDATDEAGFSSALWSAGLLEPDLIIRTGGEKRLSNFLTWQSVYSELSFTDTLWPAFSKEEFLAILADFAQRERRRGR